VGAEEGAPQTAPMRFGFAVKVLGQEGLKSNDARRWQNEPHLRVSIDYLRDIFRYLEKTDISMYRMSSDIAPYATHPDLPQFHGQIRECADDLRALGREAKRLGLRLSMHPSQFVVLNSPDPKLIEKSVWDLTAAAEILDAMELGPEAVLVIHVGGTYGDHTTGCERWIETYRRVLPEPVRRRLVLENDDIRYSAADVLFIHEHTGVPLVFDYQHFWCNNPEQLDWPLACARFLRTWPAGVRPKIHYSSPNTNLREVKRKEKTTGKMKTHLLQPVWTGHADFVNPFEFVSFLRGLPEDAPDFDVMLEAKAKDLALLRLRRDLSRYAPDAAARFGLPSNVPDPADDDVQEEIEDAAEGE
jgi:UV DNA damage endonuclease